MVKLFEGGREQKFDNFGNKSYLEPKRPGDQPGEAQDEVNFLRYENQRNDPKSSRKFRRNLRRLRPGVIVKRQAINLSTSCRVSSNSLIRSHGTWGKSNTSRISLRCHTPFGSTNSLMKSYDSSVRSTKISLVLIALKTTARSHLR